MPVVSEPPPTPSAAGRPPFDGFRNLAWLYLQPSRWEALVHRLRPDLRRDFSLVELGWSDCRANGLGSVVLRLHLAAALATLGMAAVTLFVTAPLAPRMAMTAAAYGTLLCMAGTVVVATLVGVAPAVAGAPLIGVAFAAHFRESIRTWGDVVDRARALAIAPLATSLGLDGALAD